MRKAKRMMKDYASLTIVTGVGSAAAGMASAGTPAAGMMSGFGMMAQGVRIASIPMGAGMALNALKPFQKRKRKR